jgi:hypothetical protein
MKEQRTTNPCVVGSGLWSGYKGFAAADLEIKLVTVFAYIGGAWMYRATVSRSIPNS